MGPINQRLNFQIISNQYQDILSIIDTGDTEKLKSFLNKTSSSNLPIVLNKTYHAMSVMSVLVIILSYENIEELGDNINLLNEGILCICDSINDDVKKSKLDDKKKLKFDDKEYLSKYIEQKYEIIAKDLLLDMIIYIRKMLKSEKELQKVFFTKFYSHGFMHFGAKLPNVTILLEILKSENFFQYCKIIRSYFENDLIEFMILKIQYFASNVKSYFEKDQVEFNNFENFGLFKPIVDNNENEAKINNYIETNMISIIGKLLVKYNKIIFTEEDKESVLIRNFGSYVPGNNFFNLS